MANIMTVMQLLALIVMIFGNPAVEDVEGNPDIEYLERNMTDGMVFHLLENVMVSGSKWTIIIDISISYYEVRLHKLRTELFSLQEKILQTELKNEDAVIQQALDKMIPSLKEIEIFCEELINDTRKIEIRFKDIQRAFRLNKIVKRSLFGGIGIAAKYLFGVSTTDDVDKINELVEEVKSSNQKILSINEKQISIVKALRTDVLSNSRHLQRVTQATNAIIETLNNVTESVSKVSNDINGRLLIVGAEAGLLRDFGMCELHFEALLRDAQNDINELELALLQLSRGRLSPHFLPPSELTATLEDISNALPPSYELAIRADQEHLYNYYKHVTVSAQAFPEALRLKIDIPIVAHDQIYSLVKAIPWPTSVSLPNSTASDQLTKLAYTINPEYDYILISADRQSYILLSEDEAKECQNELKLCNPSNAHLKESIENCLFNLFKKEPVQNLCTKKYSNIESLQLKRISKENIWLFYAPVESTLTITCYGASGLTPFSKEHYLTGSGIMKVPHNCALHSSGIKVIESFNFHSKIIHENPDNIKLPELPEHQVQLELAHRLSQHPKILKKITITDYSLHSDIGKDIQQLEESISKEEYFLRNLKKVKVLTYSSIGQWTVISSIIMCTIIYIVVKKCCKIPKKRILRPLQQDAEMQAELRELNN